MIARQCTLNDPAALVFIEDHPFDHGHSTIVMSYSELAEPLMGARIDLPILCFHFRLGSPRLRCTWRRLMFDPAPIALFTLGGVVVCWIVFAAIFLFRKRPPKEPEAKRDR